jgi:hypothetical protein
LGKKKLYYILFFACVAGYAWIILLHVIKFSTTGGPEVCLFKYLTNIPCPSCGSSRSVLALFNGDLRDALWWNPFGLLIFLILILSPFWIIFDLLTGQSTLYQIYTRTEQLLKRKIVFIPAILLVLANWIWNIKKGL